MRARCQRAASARAARPNAARTRIPVVITVDVEPDDVWSNHRSDSLASVMELTRLQNLLNRFGAKATLLVTYSVARASRARDVLRRLVDEAGAEVGSHLHPWENPPFLANGSDRRFHTYPHELPLDNFAAKLECLTDAVERAVKRPTSYRAGRWGLTGEHLRVLEQLGYEVDSSVIPLVDWRRTFGIPPHAGGHGGPDYRFAPRRPYRPDYANISRPGNARILEIPVTADFTRRVPGVFCWRYPAWPRPLRRVLRKTRLVRPVWCKPGEEALPALQRMLRVALTRRAAHLNMAFHSSELLLNGSPRTRSPAALERVFRRIARVLELAAASRVCEFCTLTSAARAFRSAPAGANPRPVR